MPNVETGLKSRPFGTKQPNCECKEEIKSATPVKISMIRSQNNLLADKENWYRGPDKRSDKSATILMPKPNHRARP